MELELVDEEEKVPYVSLPFPPISGFPKLPSGKGYHASHISSTNIPRRYKVGDCFVSLPQPEVLEMLSASTERIDEEVSVLKDNLESIHDQMEELKKVLYGRFGRSINLET